MFLGVCPRDPDVHSTGLLAISFSFHILHLLEEQQEAKGLVRPEPSHQVGHSPPPYPGSHQVVYRIKWLPATENGNFAGNAEVKCTCAKENLRKLTQTSLR